MSQAITPSSHYRIVSKRYCLDGGLNRGNLEYLKLSGYLSALYLCPDVDSDRGLIGGFQECREVFPHSIHIPLVSSSPEYQSTGAGDDYSHAAVLSYKRFEWALESLPTPTAIICKSANRASAVFAAFKGIKEQMSSEEIMNYARQQEMKFVNSEGLSAWVNVVVDRLSDMHPLELRQLFERESSSYTYLLYDRITLEAVLIDPVRDTIERDLGLLRDLGLHLKYAIYTHIHEDHVTGLGELKKNFPGCMSVLSKAAKGVADLVVQPYDRIAVGTRGLTVLSTPGHTEGCISLVLDDLSMVFTGDALLIRGCGRTDFRGGCAQRLHESVHRELYDRLPDHCKVMPAHDYQGLPYSTIGEEKALNPRLTKPVDQFVILMDSLDLSQPELIDTAG